MHNELRLATSDLARFLQEKLPELSEDWWAKHVVDRLSFQQQRVIGEKNISSLRELDFAALLRVLDQTGMTCPATAVFLGKPGTG